jgi:hypothetical protein
VDVILRCFGNLFNQSKPISGVQLEEGAEPLKRTTHALHLYFSTIFNNSHGTKSLTGFLFQSATLVSKVSSQLMTLYKGHRVLSLNKISTF